MNLQIRTAHVNGLELVLLFTSSDHPHLGTNYAEIEGKEALQMTLKAPTVSGMIVQSKGTGWVGLDKEKVSYVLSRLS